MGFAHRPPSPPPGGEDADLDAAFLLYVSSLIDESPSSTLSGSEAPSATLSATSRAAGDSNSNNSNNDSSGGSGGRAGEDEAKLARQRKLAAKRRRAYRERSNAELQTLRHQAAALSETLEALTSNRKSAGAGTGDSNPSRVISRSASRAPGSDADSVWRELALRQREGRLAAERLRKRLKTQVTSRQAFIQDIAGSLGRHVISPSGSSISGAASERLVGLGGPESGLVLASGETGELSPAPHPTQVRIELADASLFETYLDELDAAYARTDEVLRESGLSSQPDETRHQRISRRESEAGGEDEDFVEIVDSLVVPFRFEDVRAIMWDAIVRVHGRADREAYGSVRDPSNTIGVKFALQCRPRDGDYAESSGVPLVVTLVLRRYAERTREVLVWRAFSEGMGAVSGLSSDETGWSIAREAAMARDGPYGTDATINQTVVRFQTIRMHPVRTSVGSSSGAIGTAAGSTPPPDEGLFAKLIASSADQDGEEISRLMERLMLGEEQAVDTAGKEA